MVAFGFMEGLQWQAVDGKHTSSLIRDGDIDKVGNTQRGTTEAQKGKVWKRTAQLSPCSGLSSAFLSYITKWSKLLWPQGLADNVTCSLDPRRAHRREWSDKLGYTSNCEAKLRGTFSRQHMEVSRALWLQNSVVFLTCYLALLSIIIFWFKAEAGV